jgi:drug/metabolite transporter (DMT)-like permease
MNNIEKLRNSTQVSNLKYAIIYIGVILGMSGQQITLPLFIGSFGGLVGGYFVVFWCSCLFNLFFWPIAFYRMYKGLITNKMKTYCKTKHWKFILIGVFDGLNGILIVFSSSLDRTPGSLAAVLGSSVIPFTMMFSYFMLKKKYSTPQLLGGFLTIMGMMISLIPQINSVGEGKEMSSIMWPLVFLIGNIPGVLMNIMEENVFEDFSDFDNIFLLSWESLYQVITVGLVFWADIIPGFGTSKTFEDFMTRFSNGFTCFFMPGTTSVEKCNFSAFTGIIFTFAYCVSYIYGAALMKYSSANSTAIVSSVSPVLCVFFWLTFANLNKWGGGEEYTKLQIICYLMSLPILIVGIVMYRKSEKAQIKEQISHYDKLISNKDGLIEISPF